MLRIYCYCCCTNLLAVAIILCLCWCPFGYSRYVLAYVYNFIYKLVYIVYIYLLYGAVIQSLLNFYSNIYIFFCNFGY